MVNSEELVGTTEYLTLYTKYRKNRCRYKQVRLYIVTLLCKHYRYTWLYKYYCTSSESHVKQ